MSFADERQAIETRFALNFTALPIRYEGQRFEMPSAGGFVALKIRNGTGRQISTGSPPLHRYTGTIVVDVFVPEDTGTATARIHADKIDQIFRRAQFSAGNSGTILCRTPSISTVGVDSGWFQLSVNVPYQRDSIF